LAYLASKPYKKKLLKNETNKKPYKKRKEADIEK